MVEFNDVEKLIIKQAFVSAVGDDVATKNPDNLRGRVDEMMRRQYQENPIAGKSYDLKLLGQKVGTYSLTVSKPKPAVTSTELEVLDQDALLDWARGNGYTREVVDSEAVWADFKENGTVPDGCIVTECVTPEVVGGEVTRTTVKVQPEQVARVLGSQLEPAVYALLEGAEI